MIKVSKRVLTPEEFTLPITTSVQGAGEYPLDIALSQNYPNPFNPTMTINYNISKFSQVTLKVFDVLGREVANLVNEAKHPGIYSVQWHAQGMPSGVYFYRLIAGDVSQTRRLLLLK